MCGTYGHFRGKGQRKARGEKKLQWGAKEYTCKEGSIVKGQPSKEKTWEEGKKQENTWSCSRKTGNGVWEDQ